MNLYALSSSSLLSGPTAQTGPSGEVVDPTSCGILGAFTPSELRSILSDQSDFGGGVSTSRLPNPSQPDEPSRLGAGSNVPSGTTGIHGPSARRLMHLQGHHQQLQQQEYQQHPSTQWNEPSRMSTGVTQSHSANHRQRGPDVHNGIITRPICDTRSSASMDMDPQRLINSLSPMVSTYHHQRASSDLNGDARLLNTGSLLTGQSNEPANPNPNPVTSFARNIRGKF